MELYDLFLEFPHIATDSRTISRDDLFFALHGDRFDGNQYAARALQEGAGAAVIDNPTVLDQMPAPLRTRCTLVPDTLQALQELAAEHRRRLAIPILSITGSNGKTTTKELVSRVLARRYNLYATHGNLNNHIGVPLTLLSMDRHVEFGIVEMGASHCGEIARLCAIAAPNFGLITNIGRAHLEGFGGPEGVMRGKGELFDYLAAHNGQAFYLNQSEPLCSMVTARPTLQAIPYSTDGIETRHESPLLGVTWHQTTIDTHLTGGYNRFNIAAAIAVGTHFGITPHEIASAIESFVPDNNRSQRTLTDRNELILDYYNANPSSMQASIDNLAGEPSQRTKRVILGDMLELGPYAAAEHRTIIDRLATSDIAEALLVGTHFMEAVPEAGLGADSETSSNTDLEAFSEVKSEASSATVSKANAETDLTTSPTAGLETASTDGSEPFFATATTASRLVIHTFRDSTELHAYLKQHPISQSLILVKGSRGIHLEGIVDQL